MRETPTQTRTMPRPHTCTRFDRILSEYISLQQSMLDCLRRQHEAMRRGDAARMEACAGEQQALAATLMNLDERRLDSVRELIIELGLDAAPDGRTRPDAPSDRTLPDTMTQLIQYLPPDVAQPVHEKAQRLRELTAAVRRQGEIVRATAEHLLGHVSGLIQRINRLVNVTGLYQHDGRIDTRSVLTAKRALDLRH